MGCYLKLPPKRQVCSIGDPQKPPLAAYVFARTHGVATCYQMGVRENLAPDTVRNQVKRKKDRGEEHNNVNAKDKQGEAEKERESKKTRNHGKRDR